MLRRRDGIVKSGFRLASLRTGPNAGSLDVNTEAKTRALISTTPGTVMGTVGYMSPEQARGLTVDARTDIWSLGVVLYEMLAGRAPFVEPTATDVLVSILHKEPPPLAQFAKDIPEALEWLITKVLRKDKEERHQSAKELLSDVRAVRHQLEFQTELERSVPVDHGSPHAVSSAPNPTVSMRPAATTAEVAKGSSPFSRIWFLLLPMLAALAVVFGVFLFLRRSNEPAELKILPSYRAHIAEGIEQISWSAEGKQLG